MIKIFLSAARRPPALPCTLFQLLRPLSKTQQELCPMLLRSVLLRPMLLRPMLLRLLRPRRA